MKKIFAFLLCAMALASCSKRDPILPGIRRNIFDNGDIDVQNKEVPKLGATIKDIYGDENCNYRQDGQNTIWLGNKKIFSGFASASIVSSNQSPVCSGRFIYTGLSTGQVVKINTTNNKVVWTTDVFRENSLTGGSSVVDIVAHIGIDKNYVFAGGLGDAFCKLNANNGEKVWCLNISVPVDFIITDNFAFVVGGDNYLYAINTDNGAVYWATEIKKQITPIYNGNMLIVGKQKIDYQTGQEI